MIQHEYKFIFLHIPKCGGTSIEDAFGAWKMRKRCMVGRINQQDLQHFYLSEILSNAPNAKNYYKFTFIRNPFSRLVSEYHYMIDQSLKNSKRIEVYGISKLKLSFKEFCKNLNNLDDYCYPYHDATLLDYVVDANGNQMLDFIGRFENLQEDFNIVCDKIGIPHRELPHKIKSKHKHYTEYYDDETRQIVAERYANDIEYFGYEFGE